MSLLSGLDDLAVVTLTQQGMAVAAQLETALESAVTVYVSEKYDDTAPRHWSRFARRIHPLVDDIWGRHEAIVFVMAAGIVVRTISKHLQSKLHDPGVVVMDIRGQFAVALCSGHLGGANELCRVISEKTGATAVITTGTDVNDTLAPDILAKQLCARVEDWEPLKSVSGALVDGLPVAVYVEPGVDAGDLSRFARKKVQQVSSPTALGDARAAVMVTHRRLEEPSIPTLWIRPPTLVVGIGCNRGTSAAEIEREVHATLRENGLSAASVARVCTLTKKSDEVGLIEASTRQGWPLSWYDARQINAHAPEFPNRSEVVHRFVGVFGVAEPTALLGAGANRLLVEKQKRGNVTISVAVVAGAPHPPAGKLHQRTP